VKALQFERHVAKYAAAMVAGSLRPGGGAKVGPLHLKDIDVPELPGPDWVYVKPRLAGICGSDLSTIDGTSSRYFDPIVSFPFTMGHEIVGDLIDPANDITDADGTHRVVIEPVLGCVARNISPVCSYCAAGDLGNCVNIAFGALAPGLQTGFCCDTGGGWSTMMVAHRSQLHPVPAAMADEEAVMVEPAACALHGVFAAAVQPGESVVIIGSGTLGLAALAALRRHSQPGSIVVVAKHPVQRDCAQQLFGDAPRCSLVDPDEIKRGVRRTTGAMALGDGDITRLAGGADVVIDCVGSEASLADALCVVKPKGRIAMLGMPGEVKVDLTGLWQREIHLFGTYAYGTERSADGGERRTFDLAFELVEHSDLGRLVTATYPLARYEDAIAHAAQAGRRGAVKVAFDLRAEKERNRL